MKVLVTGATGYIGGRLVSRLVERNLTVRVLVRDRERVRGRTWSEMVEVVQGDLLKPDSLRGAFDDIDTAYYLVHSMYAGPDFESRDRRAAENFCERAGGVGHVIYLGGLQPRGSKRLQTKVSHHLQSRAEIGRILNRKLPVTEFRAGPIIGSGSASFEMLRYVTERIPIMIAPSWVLNEVCPIGVRDVIEYLLLALDRDPRGVVDIGTDPMTYKQMMTLYARQRGLRRLIIPFPPLLPTWMGAGWIGLLTPIPAELAGPLVEGMSRGLRARLGRSQRWFPEIIPLTYEHAVRRALKTIDEQAVETRWSGALPDASDYALEDLEGLVREVRTRYVEVSPERVFRVFSSLGGERGWLTWNWAWRLRGIIDRMAGGIGLRRGRRDPVELLPGEAVDCWRVESVSAPNLLRLHCELRMPGRGWLQWEATREGDGTRLVQTAVFAPQGLGGAIFWYSFYPLIRLILTRLIRAIGNNALEEPRPARSRQIADDGVPPLPPSRSESLFRDVLNFVLHRPQMATLIEFASRRKREDYTHRILQRIGVDVTSYSMLNLHKIGIDVPVQHTFREVLAWDGDSSCWPNRIAKLERVTGEINHLRIRPLGITRFPFGSNSRLGWNVSPLFELNALKIQEAPRDLDPDNARYILFSCEGGYPIGVFVLYVRSSIAHQGETGRSQVFLGVGFNFYGRQNLSRLKPLNWLWEWIHNRVTANVLSRFKQLCEWRFERLQAGELTAPLPLQRESNPSLSCSEARKRSV